MSGLQRPFLKWAGSKYSLLNRLLPQLSTGKRLIEPFMGSGAVFLNAHYKENILADVNADLVALFQWLQKDGDVFIADALALFTTANNTPESYYAMREEFNRCTDMRRRALLFLYFNRHGYNGLCRYNARGGFNVPFGRYTKPHFPAQEMTAFLEKLKHCKVQFLCQDFRTIMEMAGKGDVVYCDPPYVPLSPSAQFTTYASGGFGILEQEALAEAARAAAKRGATVILSNHDTPITRKLYHGAAMEMFDVQRLISCKGDSRNKAPELLAIY